MAAIRSAKWGGRGGYLAHLLAELGVRPLPPLGRQAGHVDEVVPLDEHVARRDGCREGDDGAIPIVVVVVRLASVARHSAARSRSTLAQEFAVHFDLDGAAAFKR